MPFDRDVLENPPILAARNLSRSFRIGGGFGRPARLLQAVRGVSFDVRHGETLAIVGESGCGKSTVARMLLGLTQSQGGEVLLESRAVHRFDRLEFARKVQPVFQDPYSSLNPRRTIVESVEEPLIIHRLGDRARRRRKAEEMLGYVGLPRRLFDAYPRQMSGGQRQRAVMARALVLEPRLIVCDEPTSALDVSIQAQILNLLGDIQRDTGVSYVLITHNMGVVEHMAHQVAVMYLGRVIESGPAADVFARPGHPYTRALLASTLVPDPDLGIPDLALGASFPDPLNVPPGCAFHPRCPIRREDCSRKDPLRHHVEAHEAYCHYPDL
ncbi:oligopeptide/dipeptide ABC transporter ATP-binding protein [Pseudogemmobacter sonorensis]|uniref:oligopeptide/dipeptide ABC transporter ATP-binding protein n=1 Tax=Pseudogemmobacter sonorensis TaxID=2989681 RepID=UPI00368CB8C6